MQRDPDYRVVIDTTPTLIFSALLDGHVDYVNRACLDYFGLLNRIVTLGLRRARAAGFDA